ncbi:hypothetical protein R7O13_23210 [Vibrio sp. Y176]|uniref:hypothetical protein n=1 Tax=Vibrio sp. Y176 TaxID=3074704 RepID=UPI002965A112|nr:hypothetical protein [Vibrio sp. Y176]MDW1630952.1 hypothetical protein [Vibrio sp. Y176]
MEILNILLTTVASSAIGVPILVYLSKLLVDNRFKKDLADHKAKLQLDNSKTIEGYKASLLRDNNEAIEGYKATLLKNNNEELERVKARLVQESKDSDRLFELEMIMQNYKAPLLHAAYELQSRIYNLVSNRVIDLYFVKEIGDGSEKNYLINNTVFVIAQYFAWIEIIKREIQFIEMDAPSKTKEFSKINDKMIGLWHGDRGQFDDPLMIWSGEQRGIGELMMEQSRGKYVCIGYAKFLKILDNEDELLINQLKSKVECYINENEYERNRLIPVQNTLIDLLEFLDKEYKRFPKKQREKIPNKAFKTDSQRSVFSV